MTLLAQRGRYPEQPQTATFNTATPGRDALEPHPISPDSGPLNTYTKDRSVTTRGGFTVKLMKLNPQGPFQGPVPNFIFIFFCLKKAYQRVQASSLSKSVSIPGHSITLGEFSL